MVLASLPAVIPAPDPVRLEVFHQLFAALCEEAGALLQRAAISPNIRERRDFSVALFDGEARMVAQAAHIPVHLGSAGDAVRAVQECLELGPGDVALVNDPYQGGTHLPDITAVRPVFSGSAATPSWFLVCRAHHADVGGASPGSMASGRDLHAEGLVLPPVLLRRAGRVNGDLLRLLLANVRAPGEREGDLRAQEACLERMERRIQELHLQHGNDTMQAYGGHLIDYTSRIVAARLRELPRGVFSVADRLDGDGLGNGPFAIRLDLTLDGRGLRCDWRRSANAAPGSVNANRSIAMAAAVYGLRCLCPGRLPTNEGLFRHVEVLTRPGSLLQPHRPAPVAGGNVETSQRLVDTVLAALARALPKAIPAASAGTMTNLTLGGRRATAAGGEESYTHYETLPGGAGAGPSGPGASGLQTHMTNTRNTSVEEMERRMPVHVAGLTIVRGSGGKGARPGGDGLRKRVVALEPMRASWLAERHTSQPAGAAGGGPGRSGRCALLRGMGLDQVPSRSGKTLLDKAGVELAPGDMLTVETPGGGGHGRPRA